MGSDLKALLEAEAERLGAVYADICADLVELYDRAGWLRAQVEREAVAGFRSSVETSVAARDREVRERTVDWRAELFELEGKIDAHRVSAGFVERLLDDRH